ncbi:MAG TPA: phosphoribosylaminoimidazolesuccinocarboxamide synthase [Candidatus Paceibacterota bacterium]
MVRSKDDITAGDGAKHDIMQGKAAIANQTTVNVFNLLKECGIPLAFIQGLDETSFLARNCRMIPLEVVVRREAHGSYLKRNPHLEKGHIFPQLICEFFLKTSGKEWYGRAIPEDDPLIVWGNNREANLYLPKKPMWEQKSFMTVDPAEIFSEDELNSEDIFNEDPQGIERMTHIAKATFFVLEKAWQILGRRLVDFKVEFGIDHNGNLVLADVIDNDSWRVIEDGEYIDKQFYRDGGALDEVTAKYAHVRDLTGLFGIPHQQLILWRASDKDNFGPLKEAFVEYGSLEECQITEITRSLHKEPVRAYLDLAKAVRNVPDSVLIALVGRSNGAGPTLSAQTSIPVITVPATGKDFPEDLWSSLRTPSETPVATIMEPANAILQALQILALRNPLLYSRLRIKQERRLMNIAAL